MISPASVRRFHSTHDPAGEASRFLAEMQGNRHPSCILILGGAEDWLSEAARNRFPSSRILSIQYDPSLRGRGRSGADLHWYPGDGDLTAFLADGLSGHTDGGVAVLPWKPSAAAFPELADRILRAVRSALEETSSNAATIRYWSLRWVKNALRNFVESDHYLLPSRASGAVVIAAAGPSLETSLENLQPFRNHVRLWALSSAWGACIRDGWEPELLLTTDAGFWSDRHFDAFLRTSSAPRTPLAALLTARIPARAFQSCALILLSQGQPLENDLAAAARLDFQMTKPRGTAASDAISLALECTTGPLILAGLDMASMDLRSHCRPYGFDAELRRKERRLKPHHAQQWDRETAAFPVRFGAWRRARSFDLYADGIASNAFGRIFRLSPSPVPVPGTLPLNPDGLADLLVGPPPSRANLFHPAGVPDRVERIRIARSVLRSWAVETAAAIRNASAAGLTARSRYLLYALGGASAAPFLAETARGRYDGALADRALQAVTESVSALERLES